MANRLLLKIAFIVLVPSEFCSNFHLCSWSQVDFSNFIYGYYGPGPKWSFAQITIMVLVLVLSGKWGSAQIFFHGNYGK